MGCCLNCSFCPKLRYFTEQNWPKGGRHGNEFLVSSNKKRPLKTVRVQKVDAKNEVICIFSMFPSWGMVFKLSKKVHILQYGGDLSKKLRSVKAICIYSSESSHYTLSKNDMVYRGLSHCSWDISNWNVERDADSVQTYKVLGFHTLIPPK